MRNKLIHDHVKTCKKSCLKNGMVVLGLAKSHHEEYRRYVFTPILSGLRWPGQTVMGSWPPALVLGWERERTEEEKKREVLHLFRCYTHTHTRPEPGQPWKAKGRKRRTQTTGRRPEQRRGGRGTNGPPKPTYTAKRTWPKQRTHLNPTTHYGEARGEN